MPRMLVEMPRRVWPAAGARTVRFPWSPARAVLTALSDARSTLSTTLDTRAWNALLATGWEGAYRDEFDDAYARLCAAASDLVERAATRAESVIDAAGDANRDQVRENEHAAGLTGVAAGPG
jgi:uncharacterized protein YukE